MLDESSTHSAAEEKPVFTAFVKTLLQEQKGGEPCSEELFRRTWLMLRRGLIRELQRRGLWQASPNLLGIAGEYWTEQTLSGPTTSDLEEDPLDELVGVAYEFVFVDRLTALCDQLEIKPSIDGLVFLNLRHILYERQRRFDPLGYRIFKVLHQAILGAVEEGAWNVVSGNPKIRNDTVLSVAGGLGGPADADRVADLTGAWAESLMPELVTAQGKAQRRLVMRIREAIAELPRHGVECFRCGDLIRGLRDRSRQLWISVFDAYRGPTAFTEDPRTPEGRTALVLPNLGFQDRDSFEALLDCVGWKIDLGKHRADGDLPRLWRLLTTFAQDDDAGKAPSQRQLARLLEIPRDRLPDLLCQLRTMIEDCRRHFRNVAVASSMETPQRGRPLPIRKERP